MIEPGIGIPTAWCEYQYRCTGSTVVVRAAERVMVWGIFHTDTEPKLRLCRTHNGVMFLAFLRWLAHIHPLDLTV